MVEVVRKAYLASIVPVIVNIVLNEHQLIVDIVAFVAKGDFPRSRLGEKQRGKILGSWVGRKINTIAQFGIRDPDGADSQITEVAEPRSTATSVMNGSIAGAGSSLRYIESIAPTDDRRVSEHTPPLDFTPNYDTLPIGISEMPAIPADYAGSIQETPPLPEEEASRDDDTPTDVHARHFGIAKNPFSQGWDDSPEVVPSSTFPQHDEYANPYVYDHSTTHDGPNNGPPQLNYDPPLPAPPPRYDSKPTLSFTSSTPREVGDHDRWALSAQQPARIPPTASAYHPGGGRLQIANPTDDDEDDSWPQKAVTHMKLGGSSAAREDRYDGSGYGTAM